MSETPQQPEQPETHPADEAPASSQPEQPPLPKSLTFRITPVSLLAVVAVLVCATPLAWGAYPWGLLVYLVPLGLAWWILRTRTTVSPERIAVRTALGKDAIVGAYAAASRHEGMAAGEIGADYVSFGPVAASGLGDGKVAPFELFRWWSEMIELPVVAEGGLTPELAAELAGVADFLALGPEIWSAPEGEMAALAGIVARL